MNYRLSITAAVAVVLASLSLLTVIHGTGWLWAGIGAVVVVGAAGAATRLAPLPAAAIAAGLVLVASVPLLTWSSWPLRVLGVALILVVAASARIRTVLPALADVGTYLAALLIYLNLLFAGPQSLGWVIPTVRSMRHLGTQISQGYAEHQFAPPVPGIHGIELIAAAGIGAVAILTDLLAVRMRSPAVAGLPLLVLFAVPVATNVKHVGAGLTAAFCAGITGYLALLAADGRERLRLWGRLVTVWQDQPDDEEGTLAPDTRALAASGRRIGLAAVAVAVIVPLALPGLKEHGLFGKTAAPGAGSNPVAPPAPLVQMRSQLFGHSNQPFLTYRTTAADPSQQYLQVYVLNYDNPKAQWTLADRSPSTTIGEGELRAAPGLDGATTFSTSRTTITIGKTSGYKGEMNYLPAPYAPQFMTVPGSGWQETNSTLMLYGYRSDSDLTYTVTSKTANPTLAQLSGRSAIPATVKNSYLAYAGPDRTRLTQIARTITQGATTPFAKAEALQGYFTQSGSFTYSLRDPAPTVLKFLTTDKRGFCQQFSFSMAVLARLIGIPSRIAVGYTAGSRIGHHAWKVTAADAHSWPELYFPGAGWLRFEPTPGGPGAQGTATTPVYASPAGGSAPTTNPITGQQNPAPQNSTSANGLAPQLRKPAR